MAIFSRITSLFSSGTPAKGGNALAANDSSPTLVDSADSPVQSHNYNKSTTGGVKRSSYVGSVNNLQASNQLRKTFPPSPRPRPLHKPTTNNDSTAKDGQMDALIRHRGSMSPNTRVDFLLGKSGYRSHQAAGAKRKHVSHRSGSTSDKKIKIIKEEDEDDDLDGSTILVTDHADDDYVSESERQIQREASEAWDDIDETLVEDQESPESQLSQAFEQSPDPETDSLFVSISQLLVLGWPIDTTQLVQKLHQRGREPILPAHWKMDFHDLPDGLFLTQEISSDREDRQAFIRSLGALSDFKATKALSSLFQLPGRARDKVHMRLDPERLVASGINKYITWAYNDAGLAAPSRGPRGHKNNVRILPMPKLILTQTAPKTLDAGALERVVMKRLTDLRERWTIYLSNITLKSKKDVHTVYAVVISHTNVAVVAFSGHGLRQVGHFDLGEEELDVWNALALAVLGIHGRNIARGYSSLQEGWAGSDKSPAQGSKKRRCSEDPDL